MAHHGWKVSTLIAMVATRTLAGCSHGVPVRHFEGLTGQALTAVQPGGRVLLAPAFGCDLRGAKDMGEALNPGGQPTTVAVRGGRFLIEDAMIDSERGRVALALRATADGTRQFVSTVPGTRSCLYPPDLPGLDEAEARLGKPLAFAPHLPGCTSVLGDGSGMTRLFQGSRADALVASSVEVRSTTVPRPADADEAPVGGPKNLSTWLRFSPDLAVSFASVDRCFVAASSKAAPPPSVQQLLHVNEGACLQDSFEGTDHLNCNTSVGVWFASSTPAGLVAQLRHRTLGPIHFLAGGLVDAAAFGGTRVAIRVEAGDGSIHADWSAAVDVAVRQALGAGTGAQPTPFGDPNALVSVSARVTQVAVGDVVATQTNVTTQYRSHQVEVRNEKKDEAEREVERAARDEERARRAARAAQDRDEASRRDHERNVALCDEAADVAGDVAKTQGRKAGATTRTVGKGMCRVGAVALRPTRESPSAEQALKEAERAHKDALASAEEEPATKKRWVMNDWTYTKRVLSRQSKALVEISLVVRGGAAETRSQWIEHTINDYEVAGDPAHGVVEHRANPALSGPASGLISLLVEPTASWITRETTQATDSLAQDRAVEALRTLGRAPGKEDEAVDAAAFSAVGARLGGARRRGSVRGPEEILVDDLGPAPYACLLVVAAAGPNGTSELESRDGRLADVRKGRVALIEACGPVGPLVFNSSGAGRWAAFDLVSR